jgi:hypothetical protein
VLRLIDKRVIQVSPSIGWSEGDKCIELYIIVKGMYSTVKYSRYLEGFEKHYLGELEPV